MFEISSDWFSPGFEPHGHCFVAPLLWLYVASDSWIAFSLSYVPIAVSFRLRHHASFGNMETPKEPVYWLDRSVKTGNCGSSVATAAKLWPFREVLALASRGELENG
jgi:hypothetical protein